MRTWKKKIQKHKKKTKNYDTHTLSPHPYPLYKSTTPTYPICPIVGNNNTMDIAFLVQMRQSNKRGSAKNDEIINLHLGSGLSYWLSIPCVLQDISHIYWFHPPKQWTRRKRNNPEMRSNSQQSYFSKNIVERF